MKIYVLLCGGGGGSTNPEVLVFVVVLIIGELLNGSGPAGEAAEGAAGESIEVARDEEESSGRDRLPAGWFGEWEEEDAQPATQAATHTPVGCYLYCCCCGGGGGGGDMAEQGAQVGNAGVGAGSAARQ